MCRGDNAERWGVSSATANREQNPHSAAIPQSRGGRWGRQTLPLLPHDPLCTSLLCMLYFPIVHVVFPYCACCISLLCMLCWSISLSVTNLVCVHLIGVFFSMHAWFCPNRHTPFIPTHARCGNLSFCRFTDLRTASVHAFHPAETFMTCLTQSRPCCFLRVLKG